MEMGYWWVDGEVELTFGTEVRTKSSCCQASEHPLDLTHRDELTLYTMPAKPRFLCMDKDDGVWQKLDDATDEWDKSIRTNEIYRAVGNLILQYRNGQPEVMHAVVKGGYNIIYRLEYSDGSSAIMRIPVKSMPRAL
jgi:hypothetical protein